MAAGDLISRVFVARAASSASTGTHDVRNGHDVLNCAGDGTETFIVEDVLFGYDGAGLAVHVLFALASATSGNVEVSAAFERVGTVLDIDADSFAAALDTGDVAVPATSGIPMEVEIPFAHSEIGGLLDEEAFRLKIAFPAASTGNAAGDRQILAVWVVNATEA